MAETSTIEWTDATWNPITGCTLVSEGCRHCYAAQLAATRLKNHPTRAGLARLTAAGEAKFTGEVRLNEQWLDQPLRWRRPRKIFVCAHGDLFHEDVPDEWIDQVFAVMALAPQHTFQVLTKRPERALRYFSGIENGDGWLTGDGWRGALIEGTAQAIYAARTGQDPSLWLAVHLPLPNVWLGTSVEDQATADARIPHLIDTPAAVRFLSAEPLLGPLDPGYVTLPPDHHARSKGIHAFDALRLGVWHREPPDLGPTTYRGLDWVIVGGESGRRARAMHPDWVRALRDQCVAAGVRFFFKQWGEWAPSTPEEAIGNPRSGWLAIKAHPYVARAAELCPEAGSAFVEHKGKKAAGRLLDGRTWDEMPREPGRD